MFQAFSRRLRIDEESSIIRRIGSRFILAPAPHGQALFIRLLFLETSTEESETQSSAPESTLHIVISVKKKKLFKKRQKRDASEGLGSLSDETEPKKRRFTDFSTTRSFPPALDRHRKNPEVWAQNPVASLYKINYRSKQSEGSSRRDKLHRGNRN